MKIEKDIPDKVNQYDEILKPRLSEESSVQSIWERIKDEYHLKYPNLTKRDLSYVPGAFDKMTSLIASKTDRCRAEVNNEIRSWEASKKP
ncbi:hypothetical protein [Gelidibacter pelagius]|uniref:Uncharacterized protein n=1 Tax=Gelidibacter pelagius TaxID=2819985 RepID=A0ABS3STG9_9FLAO|nr:hypothetical protein [Gelidibacter pelagius]MBO3098999.1 hypothetical protein [Gelidibacter pelagius]